MTQQPNCKEYRFIKKYDNSPQDVYKRQGLSNAVRDEHLALVQLYKALGGGWELEEE